MITKVYSVFPTCGKTWLYKHQEDYGLKILDLDSSNFNWIITYNNENRMKQKNPDFPTNYIKHIKENIDKYDCIFVSSHTSVRKALDEENIDFTIVYPHSICKDEWIGRCFVRDMNGESGCGAEAMYNNWEQWIAECVETAVDHKEIILQPTEHLSDYFQIQ